MHFDEPSYVARLVRALQGTPSMAPWLYEHRLDVSVVPAFVEQALALPFRAAAHLHVPTPSFGSVVVAYRALFAFSGVMAVAFALHSIGMPRRLAALAAFWSYADSGLANYKPFAGLVLGTLNLPFDRFTNPLVGMSLFFLAWGCMTHTAKDDHHVRAWAVGSGILGGVLFYVSFYYWTFFVAMSAAAVCVRPARWRPLAALVGLAALESLPYWLYIHRVRMSPYYADILWREELMTSGHVWNQYSNKTLLPLALAALTAWRIRSTGARLLVVSVIAGLLCFFSPAATGMVIQAAHWHCTLAPMITAACLWSVAHALEPRCSHVCRAWIGGTCAAALLVGGVLTVVRWDRFAAANPDPGIGANDRAYASAWRWLRSRAPEGSVVIASELTMGYVPLRTGLYVWAKQHANSDAVSFEEVWDRYRTLLTLDADARRELVKRECAPGGPFSVWFNGLPSDVHRSLEDQGRPPFDRMRTCSLANDLVGLSARTNDSDLTAIGVNYRLDYVVRGPNERSWLPAERIWSMTRVFEADGVTIDRVKGWRQTDPESGG
jgi:hypothetical protein